VHVEDDPVDLHAAVVKHAGHQLPAPTVLPASLMFAFGDPGWHPVKVLWSKTTVAVRRDVDADLDHGALSLARDPRSDVAIRAATDEARLINDAWAGGQVKRDSAPTVKDVRPTCARCGR
jgi:hypothetical protein